MRCGFEQTALAAAMEGAQPEELARMKEVLEKMDQPMSAQDSAALDVKFHKILMEMSHNQLMIFYVDQMEDLLKLFVKDLRTSILSDRRRATVLRKAHWDIYEALAARDEAAGRESVKEAFYRGAQAPGEADRILIIGELAGELLCGSSSVSIWGVRLIAGYVRLQITAAVSRSPSHGNLRNTQ